MADTAGRFLGFLMFALPAMLLIAALILLPEYKRYADTQYNLACLQTKLDEAKQFVEGNKRLIRDLLRPDLAILPIGGHFTMGPREAALAVELLGVKHVLPIHYGTFPILAGTPAQLRDELAARGLDDVTVYEPEPGGTLDRPA
jgi:hypothetical protein